MIQQNMNVSISTNRNCSLRCDHCFIQPHMFLNKQYMSIDVYKGIFDRIEEFLDHNPLITQLEWEVMGGETTLLPFSWWETMLPWTLERIGQFNRRFRDEGVLHFLTNLMYPDSRYTGLLNEFGHHPLLCIYTSWEPDTGRFGLNNKLLGRFLDRLKSIDSHHKTVNIMLSKETIKFGAERILDMFVPLGVTDFSMQMINPFGSGKDYFKKNNPSYLQMSEFIIDFHRAKPFEISFTPVEEMFNSLHSGSITQWNGNTNFDLSFDVDGTLSLNPNCTGSEKREIAAPMNFTSSDWIDTLDFASKKEQVIKHVKTTTKCLTCKHLTYCGGGWFLHKEEIAKTIASDSEECSGLSKVWDMVASELGKNVMPKIMPERILRIKKSSIDKNHKRIAHTPIDEAYYVLTKDMLMELKPGRSIMLIDGDRFNLSPASRVMHYFEKRMIVTFPKFKLASMILREPVLWHILIENVELIEKESRAEFLNCIISMDCHEAKKLYDLYSSLLMEASGVSEIKTGGTRLFYSDSTISENDYPLMRSLLILINDEIITAPLVTFNLSDNERYFIRMAIDDHALFLMCR